MAATLFGTGASGVFARSARFLGTDGLPGPAGGNRAVAKGERAATFACTTGVPQAIEMAKAILLYCAETVPATVTAPTVPGPAFRGPGPRRPSRCPQASAAGTCVIHRSL